MAGDENIGSVRPFGFRAPRVSTNFSFSIEVAGTGERYEAVCTDISEDGLAADVIKPVTPKAKVTMRLLLPGAIRPLHIEGSVEYSQDRRCGLTFLYASAEERNQIQR